MELGIMLECKKSVENCFTFKKNYFINNIDDNMVWVIGDNGNAYPFYMIKMEEHQKFNILKHYFNFC
jgi:hypothetical protein